MIACEDLRLANCLFEAEFREAFERVLASGRYISGPELEALEVSFSEALGLGRSVGLGSGYDAITISFMALSITGGEVIVPANTYMATILAAIRAGLKPVLCEPDPETLLIDPARLERHLTKRTVALLPVHLYGLACDMDTLTEFAKANRLVVVEDCAQAAGAGFAGKSVGAFGDAGAFSFYPTKNIGALGDAGLAAFKDGDRAERAQILRNYGASGRAVAEAVGFNSRLDELQAAFLRVKLRHLDEITEAKNRLAAFYDENLHASFKRPAVIPGSSPARSLYVVTHPKRDELRAFLFERGISTDVHYPVPPHRQRAIAPYADEGYPVTEKICAEIVTLPFSLGHTQDDVERVVEEMNRFAAFP